MPDLTLDAEEIIRRWKAGVKEEGMAVQDPPGPDEIEELQEILDQWTEGLDTTVVDPDEVDEDG